MQTEKGINLCLSRVQIIGQKQQKKVEVVVYCGSKIQIRSNIKKLRKGVANFYRETFNISEKCKSIAFQIIDVATSQTIHSVAVEPNLIENINFHNNCYCSIGDGIKIQWEAMRLGGAQCQSTIDTHKQNFQFGTVFQEEGQQYNLLQPAIKIREKRKISLKATKNSQAISQPSQKGDRTLQLANSKLFDKNNKIELNKRYRYNILTERQKQKITVQYKNSYDFQNKEKNKQISKKNIQQPSKKVQQQSGFIQYKKSLLKNPKLIKFRGVQENKINSLKRSKYELLFKISLREIISTTLFGIAAGFAATQF